MMQKTTGSLLRLNRLRRFHYRKQDTIKVLFSTSEREEQVTTTATPSVVPGIAAAAGVSTFGFLSADVLSKGLLAMQGLEGSTASVVSGIPVAILAGLALNNLTTLPSNLVPGFKTCSTTLLRAGIICVGFKLSFFEMASLGAYGVPCVAASVGMGLLVTTSVARAVSYTHLRAHETVLDLVCRLLLE